MQGAEDHSGIQEIFERVAARLLSIGRAQAEHGVRKARLRAGRPAQKEARFDGRVAPASGALQRDDETVEFGVAKELPASQRFSSGLQGSNG